MVSVPLVPWTSAILSFSEARLPAALPAVLCLKETGPHLLEKMEERRGRKSVSHREKGRPAALGHPSCTQNRTATVRPAHLP